MLVVDTDPVRREGLVACLVRHRNLTVVGSGPDLLAALGSPRSSSDIDILLINVDQPATEGV